MTTTDDNDQPVVIKVVINGVDLPIEVFASSTANEDSSARVAAALDEVEAAESPELIISPASWS